MRIPFDQMCKVFQDALLDSGFSRERAALCARIFAESSLDGVYSHGVNRFAGFVPALDRAASMSKLCLSGWRLLAPGSNGMAITARARSMPTFVPSVPWCWRESTVSAVLG